MQKQISDHHTSAFGGATAPSLAQRLASLRVTADLDGRCQWVAWRYEERNGALTKPPLNPVTGDKANVSDPSTWGSLDQALACLTDGGADGVGIVLTGSTDLVGIDLDHCIDDKGNVSPWVRAALDEGETYAEFSPSGHGVRMLARGKLDKAVKDASAGVELYDRGRYLTVTGDRVPGAPDAICEAPLTLRHLHARVTEKKVEHALVSKAAASTRKRATGTSGDFYRSVNNMALDNLKDWVPDLLSMATPSTNGYRVSSHDLGRDYQEDLSITSQGIVDFGPADQGDVHEGRRTPIDLVIEHGEEVGLQMHELDDIADRAKTARLNGYNASIAAEWLCEHLNVSPWNMGKEPKSEAEWLSYMNEKHAVVFDGGRTWVIRHDVDDSKTPSRSVIRYMSIPAFRDYYANKLVTVPRMRSMPNKGELIQVESEENIEVGKWWFKNAKRRQYEGVTFFPGGERVHNGKLNLWEGFTIPAIKGDWSLTKWHIENVVASGIPELSDYILKWCAYAVQYPNRPAETALVLKGKRGTGKGTLAKALLGIFGQHGQRISNPTHLVGNFNAHLRDTVLLFADEAYWPGNKGAEGSLKSLITESTIRIEMKGRDTSEEPNYLHIIMASNEDWVVPAGPEERRYCVVEVSDCKIQDHVYFKALNQQLEAGGLAAMLFDLQAADLEGWHPRQIPVSSALTEQQDVSMSAEDSWWETKLSDGFILHADVNQPDKVASFHLIADFKAFSPKLAHYNEKSFSVVLTRYGCTKGKKIGSRQAWLLPNLSEARAKWVKRYKGTIWDDPERTEWGTSDEAANDLQLHLFGPDQSGSSALSPH